MDSSNSTNFHGYNNFGWALHNFTYTNIGGFSAIGVSWQKIYLKLCCTN